MVIFFTELLEKPWAAPVEASSNWFGRGLRVAGVAHSDNWGAKSKDSCAFCYSTNSPHGVDKTGTGEGSLVYQPQHRGSTLSPRVERGVRRVSKDLCGELKNLLNS